jgi:hypothetical protein
MDAAMKEAIVHARNDVMQACVLLVSARFGAAAGEWLLGEYAKAEKGPDEIPNGPAKRRIGRVR